MHKITAMLFTTALLLPGLALAATPDVGSLTKCALRSPAQPVAYVTGVTVPVAQVQRHALPESIGADDARIIARAAQHMSPLPGHAMPKWCPVDFAASAMR